MGNLFDWIMANVPLVATMLGIVLALVYAWSKGQALDLIAQVWALVVSLAGDVLAGIPDAEFAEWAQLIHAALPSIAQLFIREAWIKSVLIHLRDVLVGELKPSKALWALEDYHKVTMRVRQYLA